MIFEKKPRKDIIEVGFLISVQLLVFLIGFILFDYFNLFFIEEYINLNIFSVITGVFCLYFFYWKFKKNEFAKQVIPYIFLISLIPFVINSFWKISFIMEYNFILFVLSVMFGVVSLLLNKEVIEETENEVELEKKAEEKREKEFDLKFKRLTKFNFDYRVSSSWEEKKYLLFVFRVLISPFIWLIRLPYSFVKWMYKEGWWYSLVFFCILIFGTIFSLLTIKNMSYTIDEGYTLDNMNAYYKYGELGKSISGAKYERSETYNLLVSINSFFFNETKFKLRFVNYFFYISILFFIYLLLKNLNYNKITSLLTTFLLSFNWFFLIIFFTARPYFLAIFFFFIIFLFIVNINLENKLYFSFIIFFLLLFNYLEGFSIYSLHLILIIFLLLLIIFQKLNFQKLILYSILVSFSFLVLFLIIFIVNFSSILFIIQTFKISFNNIYLESIIFFGSIISHINQIGLIFLLILILYTGLILLFKKNNFNSKLIIILTSTILVQVFIFSSKNSYPQYLADLYLVLYVLLVPIGIELFKVKYLRKISILFILILVISSGVNIYKINNSHISYSFYQPSNWEIIPLHIPENSIVITDMPNTLKLVNKNYSIYALRDNPNDLELVFINGTHYNFDVNKNDPKITVNEIILFENFDNYSKLIYSDNQLYLYYDKTPKIMSIKQLEYLSKNQKIFFVLTHNAFENLNKKDNYPLRNYIDANSIIISHYEQENFCFDSREFNTIFEKKVNIANPKLITIMVLK